MVDMIIFRIRTSSRKSRSANNSRKWSDFGLWRQKYHPLYDSDVSSLRKPESWLPSSNLQKLIKTKECAARYCWMLVGSYFLQFSSTFTMRHRTPQNVDADAHQKNVNILILAWRLQQVVAKFSNANSTSGTKREPQRHYEIASQPRSRWNMLLFSMELLTFSIRSPNVNTQAENMHSCKCA